MKILRFFLLLFFTGISWLFVRQYFFCPQFSFTAGIPFSGNQLYNPYAGIDSGIWAKCNFHAHSNAWKGLTNGHGVAADVWNAYDSLGYTIHCVSDYEEINKSFSDKKNYVPVYEHGYNIRKTHELVVGAREVKWLDYFFPQTLSNKQDILNKLTDDTDNIVILGHPALRNGFKASDLKYLANYRCMEVLNPSVSSFPHWDTALSAGKAVFIAGDDDTHNVFDLHSTGLCCTWLNVPSVNCKNVLDALKQGRGYGMRIAILANETMKERTSRLKHELPALKDFKVSHDTIQLAIDKPASEIKFIGQNGKTLATINEASQAIYIIKPEDHYARAAISFSNGAQMFLNPVFFYSGPAFTKTNIPVLNNSKTLLFFLLGLVLFLTFNMFVINFLFRGFLPKSVKRFLLPSFRRKSDPELKNS
jgi:hypothetical protein